MYLTNDDEPDTHESRVYPMEVTPIVAQNLAHFLVPIQFKQIELCSDGDDNMKIYRWTLKQSSYSISFGDKSAKYMIKCTMGDKVNY